MVARADVSALHGSLLSALGTAIVSGQYPSGQLLTLDGVDADHGVSRSVAREAIRVLESMGMVRSRRRVGITVQPAAHWNVDPVLIRWPTRRSVPSTAWSPRCWPAAPITG